MSRDGATALQAGLESKTPLKKKDKEGRKEGKKERKERKKRKKERNRSPSEQRK